MALGYRADSELFPSIPPPLVTTVSKLLLIRQLLCRSGAKLVLRRRSHMKTPTRIFLFASHPARASPNTSSPSYCRVAWLPRNDVIEPTTGFPMICPASPCPQRIRRHSCRSAASSPTPGCPPGLAANPGPALRIAFRPHQSYPASILPGHGFSRGQTARTRLQM